MSRITALDWLNANIKSEDLNESRVSLGLNKKAKQIHDNADTVDNVGAIEDFAYNIKSSIEKELGIDPRSIEITSEENRNGLVPKVTVSFFIDEEDEKGIVFQIATEDCKEEDIIGMFGCCAYDNVTGSCRPCRIDFNDFIDLGDEAVAPDDHGLFVMCGEMYPCNTEYLEAMIAKIKSVKERAEQGDFSAWSWFQPF